MAKIKVDSLINIELKKLETKVNEFQKYLEINPITSKDSYEDQDKLHKEIAIQIKINYALFDWLPLLEKLKAGDQGKGVEIRGDQELNGLFKNRSNDK